jgi:hypothetical protein
MWEALRRKITIQRVIWSAFRGVNYNSVGLRVLFYSSKISKGYKQIIENVSIAILHSFKTAPCEMYENVTILVR